MPLITLLERAIAEGGSVCVSVLPSVRHTREPHLYELQGIEAYFSPYDKGMFPCSFLRPNVIFLSSGVHSERVWLRRVSPVKSKVWPIIHN